MSSSSFLEALRLKCRVDVARYTPHDINEMTNTDLLGYLYKQYVLGLGIINLTDEEEHYLHIMELVVWRSLTMLWFA